MLKKILLIGLILTIAGCITDPGNGGNARLEKDLYTGTRGVQMEISRSLPSEVQEGEDLSYTVEFTNYGPYATNGRMLVSLERGYMSFPGGSHIYEMPVSLEGKTLYNYFDDFTTQSVLIHTEELDPNSEIHETSVQTLLCYDYRGIAIADVCIDTDPHDTRPADKPCVAGDISMGSGQGGPVIIDVVETNMLVDNDYIRPQFKIHVRNIGQGTVIKPGSTDTVCSRAPAGSGVYNIVELTNVELSTYSLSGGDFDCIPDLLTLRREEDFFTCTMKTGRIQKNSNYYVTPLRVEIDYGYMQSQTKEIRIQKILT